MSRQSAVDGAWSLEARRSDSIFSRLRRVKPGLLLRALQSQPSPCQASPHASRWEPLSSAAKSFLLLWGTQHCIQGPTQLPEGTWVSGRVHSVKCPSARNKPLEPCAEVTVVTGRDGVGVGVGTLEAATIYFLSCQPSFIQKLPTRGTPPCLGLALLKE